MSVPYLLHSSSPFYLLQLITAIAMRNQQHHPHLFSSQVSAEIAEELEQIAELTGDLVLAFLPCLNLNYHLFNFNETRDGNRIERLRGTNNR